MMNKDPKKMASGVLMRAFGGEVSSGKKGNYQSPSAAFQKSPSLFGDPGSNSNFGMPEEDVQEYSDGGEVDEGKKVAAEELCNALGIDTSKALHVAQAMESFIDQCQSAEAMELNGEE